jgi:hypothetical protein
MSGLVEFTWAAAHPAVRELAPLWLSWPSRGRRYPMVAVGSSTSGAALPPSTRSTYRAVYLAAGHAAAMATTRVPTLGRACIGTSSRVPSSSWRCWIKREENARSETKVGQR